MWPVLTPMIRGKRQEVVPGKEPPAAGDVGALQLTARRMNGSLHGDAREPRHVAGARDLPGCVEPAGVDEVRVSRARARAPSRSSARRSARPIRRRHAARAPSRRRSRSARARPSPGRRTVTRSPGAEVDGGLADGGRGRRHRDDVVRVGVLERHEHGHQLGDAGDRQGGRRLAGARERRVAEGAAVAPCNGKGGAGVGRLGGRLFAMPAGGAAGCTRLADPVEHAWAGDAERVGRPRSRRAEARRSGRRGGPMLRGRVTAGGAPRASALLVAASAAAGRARSSRRQHGGRTAGGSPPHHRPSRARPRPAAALPASRRPAPVVGPR